MGADVADAYLAALQASDPALVLGAQPSWMGSANRWFYEAYDAVLDILRDECDALDPSLLDEMEGALQELLLLDERDPTQVNGFGRYRDAAVIAFLNAQDEPVPVSLLEEKVGAPA